MAVVEMWVNTTPSSVKTKERGRSLPAISVFPAFSIFLRGSNYKKHPISPENYDDNISSLGIFVTLILFSC